ncbi:Bug family tripartite tricarboxylate transporter substrate binding protein [Polaromonas sp. YR568]|uniref:Bug family tripartite tricarboxylate transporter substrate binding protein n=1 Tax=Polaromonas sp. YR568 TaxID=1855301 RepID=UPI00398BECFE
MNVTRRAVLGAAAASLSAAPALQALAQSDWPSRPVRLISPYAAGGASDISARILAEHLRGTLGQTFLVENKPGAGTRIANELAARAAPDGYTVLYAAAPYATAEALYGKQAFDPRKDLKPVAMAALAPLFLIVNSETPFKTVKDFIAFGKARPDGLTFASPGAGSQPHLAAQLLLRDAGVKGLNAHVRGDAVAYTELLAGRVDATFTAITTALPHIESGKLRVLGVASAARSPIYPQAPTLSEQGFPNVIASGWYGFMVPAATPASITARLQAAVIRALSDATVKSKLLAQGLDARGTTAAEFGKFIEDETRKWTDVIRKAGIKGE